MGLGPSQFHISLVFFLLFGIILPLAYFSRYFSYFWNFGFPPNYLSTRWFSLDPKALAKTGVIGRANPLAGPDHFRRFTWYRPDPFLRPRQCFDFETRTNFPLEICLTVCLAGSLSSKIILKSPRSTTSCLKALTLSSFSFLFTIHFKAATPSPKGSLGFPNSWLMNYVNFVFLVFGVSATSRSTSRMETSCTVPRLLIC